MVSIDVTGRPRHFHIAEREGAGQLGPISAPSPKEISSIKSSSLDPEATLTCELAGTKGLIHKPLREQRDPTPSVGLQSGRVGSIEQGLDKL